MSAKGALSIKEKKEGKESFGARLARFDPALTQADLGDPVGGSTIYRICIYDQNDTLAGQLTVDRAGQPCGQKQKPCWKALDGKGYSYKDSSSLSDGVKRIVAKGGKRGKGKIKVKGRNKAKKGYLSLPTNLAAALAGNAQATVQVVTSDAHCFGATLHRVKKADEMLFKAKEP